MKKIRNDTKQKGPKQMSKNIERARVGEKTACSFACGFFGQTPKELTDHVANETR